MRDPTTAFLTVPKVQNNLFLCMISLFWKPPCSLPVSASYAVRKAILRIVDTIVPRHSRKTHVLFVCYFQFPYYLQFWCLSVLLKILMMKFLGTRANQKEREQSCHNAMLHGKFSYHLVKTECKFTWYWNILNWVIIMCKKNPNNWFPGCPPKVEFLTECILMYAWAPSFQCFKTCVSHLSWLLSCRLMFLHTRESGKFYS